MTRIRITAAGHSFVAETNPDAPLTVATGSSKGTGYPGKVDLELDYGLSPTVAWE